MVTFRGFPEKKKCEGGKSLVIQWLGPCTFTTSGQGSIPVQGIKIPQALWHGEKRERENKRETSEELKMFFVWVWVMTTHVYPCAKIHQAVKMYTLSSMQATPQ